MSISRRSLMGLVAIVASVTAVVTPHSAAAQPPPSTQPLVITRPGVYVLNRDITVSSGDAITISSGGVTLDLNGRSVSIATPGTGRGIFVNGAAGVTVKNGKIGAFNINVQVNNSTNITLSGLQVVGANLPLSGGPSEIGVLLISTRAAEIAQCTISSVGLGIFVRGPISGGNNIHHNTIVGGPDTSRSPLGMCWNPLPGGVSTDPGPKGDRVYANHVSQFLTGISFSAGSTGSIVAENTIAFVNAAFSATTMSGNLVEDNKVIQVAP
jgi:nitrous oxidase accessory protein NosD